MPSHERFLFLLAFSFSLLAPSRVFPFRSRERIRQLQEQALGKIRKHMRD
ncbi:hypothetical protein AKJ09_07351 [Labilithrix luteola]|uniref:Uncharacterized protein n=1 Tax=Labilithrix luteola TaxID=1391654 RepID=A0A0K1Q4M8_9BACT|nr:hypothetical protein AKJ09_07351 [Labilithrix luteola]